VQKTFCIDCGTTVESIPRDVAEQLKQEKADSLRPSLEEALISGRILNHDDLNKDELLDALKRMHAIVTQIDATQSLSFKDTHDLFVDYVDQACEAARTEPTAFPAIDWEEIIDPATGEPEICGACGYTFFQGEVDTLFSPAIPLTDGSRLHYCCWSQHLEVYEGWLAPGVQVGRLCRKVRGPMSRAQPRQRT
jgi:hypothetical protein